MRVRKHRLGLLALPTTKPPRELGYRIYDSSGKDLAARPPPQLVVMARNARSLFEQREGEGCDVSDPHLSRASYVDAEVLAHVRFELVWAIVHERGEHP